MWWCVAAGVSVHPHGASGQRPFAAARGTRRPARMRPRPRIGSALATASARKPVPHAPMEGEIELGLEPGHIARRLAGEAGLDGKVQQDRQVRRETTRGGRLQRPKVVERDAGRRIPGTRCVELANRAQTTVRPAPSAGSMTSVTSCRRAALKSSASVIGSALDVEAVRAQEQLAEALAKPRPTRFAGQVDVEAGALEVRGKSLGLCRLAGPIRAFDGDEPATADRCPGTSHRPSVADGDAPPGPRADG